MQRSLTQKQIPTILGLIILIVSLIGGVLLIGQGGGIFAPRATAQTTPKKVTITNVKDDTFTVSFVTEDATAGFVKYGVDATKLTTQASDDRDQFSGNVGQFNTHQITLHDLKPDTTYFFTLGTSAGSKYDNSGAPYSMKTTKKTGTVPIAKTIYGTVNSADGTPASGALVYVTLPGSFQLSTLTKDSGSWAIPLANARSVESGQYRAVEGTEQLEIVAQGSTAATVSSVSVTVADAQPVKTITLGQSQSSTGDNAALIGDAGSKVTPPETSEATPAPATSPLSQTTESITPTTPSSLADLSTAQAAIQVPADTMPTPTPAAETVVSMTANTTQTVETAQPTIQGKAAPNILINVQIHSATAINTQVQTDSQGNFTVDLQQLEQQLEPGTHTITISYPDPTNSSKTITQTKTFTVQSKGLIAAVTVSPTPYSTSNPYILTSPSPTPSASPVTPVSKASTASALPKSGSTETTLLLLAAGGFFIMTGVWSFWAASRQATVEDLG